VVLFLANGWEEPGVTGGGNRLIISRLWLLQTVPGDFGAVQQSSQPASNSVIPSSVQLTFIIDMSPAAMLLLTDKYSIQTGIDTAYVQFDGCMIPITQGKHVWYG